VRTLIESQSVRRGHGRFGAPSESTSGRSVIALVSETEHDETVQSRVEEDEEEDLNTASAVYTVSTDLARSVNSTRFDTTSTRASSPLPTMEWDSVLLTLPPKLPVSLLSPKPRSLAERIWGQIPDTIVNPTPLIERIGGLYIPPAARHRDDLGFWQSQKPFRSRSKDRMPAGRDDTSWWQSQSQANTIKRQRENIRFSQIGNHPGPSRRSHLRPSFSQIAILFHTLGEKMFDIKIDEIEVRNAEKIEEVEYVGSYKWIESDDGPTLAVPGKLSTPKLWGNELIKSCT